MAEEDECEVPMELRAGIILKGAYEIHSGNKYSPQGVGGLRPNEGDTHGDEVLDVPDCPE